MREEEKMKNTTKAFVAFGIISLLAVSLVAASGFMWGEDREAMQANQESMRTAVENNDYSAWETAMRERIRVMEEQITEENFEAVKARHAEREEFRTQMENAKATGDTETMQQLKEQYGISGKIGKGRGMKQGFSGDCPYTN